MNTPITPTPNLELLRQAVQEYQPDPSRIPFSNLKPFHDSIVELRDKNASYAAIAELLEQHGVKTSRARVAEYGRIVLEDGKKRKRRKRAKNAPAVNSLAAWRGLPALQKCRCEIHLQNSSQHRKESPRRPASMR